VAAIEGTAEGLGRVLARIGEFFHLFDLSFFVAGATALGAIVFRCYVQGFRDSSMFSGVVGVGATIIAAYVLGLICFATGRPFRRWPGDWRRRRQESQAIQEKQGQKVKDGHARLKGLLYAHGLDDVGLFKDYLARGDTALDAMFSRIWVELRQRPELEPSFSFCNRFWVMAAAYDSVAIALLGWALVMFTWPFGGSTIKPISSWVAFAGGFGFIATALACFGRAHAYDRGSVPEAVAGISFIKDILKD
jgi:hypothetical protein